MIELAKGPYKGVVITDIHAPFTNVHSLQAALTVARRFKPDGTFILGDTLDALAASSYLPVEDRATIEDWKTELERCVPVYETLKAFPGHKFEWEGNHEHRLTKPKNGAIPSQFISALQVDAVCPAIARARRGWTRLPYTWGGGLGHVGSVIMMHGFGSGNSAAVREVLRARQELARAGRAYPELTVIRGHQHNLVPWGGGGPVPLRVRDIPIGISWMSPGTLGPTRCSWDPALNDSDWGPGIVLFEVDRKGHQVRCELVRL